MKYILLIFLGVSVSTALYSQTKDCTECWKINNEKTKEYFDMLFGIVTGSHPDETIIKVGFLKSGMIYVTHIQVLRKYCKQKYNLQDSSVKNFTNQFIRNGTQIPLEDTTTFKKLDLYFNKYSFFNGSMLDKFRVLGVKNFMLKYCNGDILKDNRLVVNAYLFENRIFWNNMTGRISPNSLYKIEQSCKIKWDYKNENWIDLATNKIIAAN